NEQAARAALRRVLPKNLADLKDEQLPQLEKVADLLAEELDDKQSALQLYQYLVSRNGNKVLKLAEFLGRHLEPEQGFELLEKVYNPRLAPAVVNTCLAILRARRDEIGDKFDDQVQSWLDGGLREDPESVALNMQQAEIYEVQQEYDSAANKYRNLLESGTVTGKSRAVVLNNLSYLLALKGDASNDEEAVDLVSEAVQILGPTADILDTRAVVFIARERYEDAIADLELSVTDNPTASKYFHKAIAHLKAGQNSNALEAWERAQQLGLTREEVNHLERSQFDEVASRIEQLQTASLRADGNFSQIGSERNGQELATVAY
ncbi:MAG: hypothetical protein MJA83_11930, partial [Gammaproteobacteria bacterium]|nr:hypothetical protein [Gammaproteobacteria bacterium]